ncbi:hypothetical protein [Thalassospira sp. MCCC 1A03138]|uniref:hypothetical protein n=1 Tax=Thalassospira sp. MCCC 1A03138 TaxID=1470576 RepID=UPI001FEFB2A1|nr:hypothetical protein [Thalassospira sp. MCCC 1A03138]
MGRGGLFGEAGGGMRSDLLVISKTDLALLVDANLGVMDPDAKKCVVTRPFLFTNLKVMDDLEDVKNFIIETGGSINPPCPDMGIQGTSCAGFASCTDPRITGSASGPALFLSHL